MEQKYLMFGILTLVIAIVFMVSGCVPQPYTPSANDTGATAETVEDVINANNQFAWELYTKLKDDSKNQGKNIFFSPYSISTALAMTYEGARGQTAEEMQSVFHFPENASVRQPAFAAIYNLINKPDKEYQLNTANALWAQKDFHFLDEYMNITEQYYGGKTTELDFVEGTEKSRQIINSWVEDQTNNKIKDLIPQGVLNPMTRLVLTNAIYFKGDWVMQFDKKNTKETDFYVTPEETVKVQMMSQTGEESIFNYTETEALQVLELPYSGNELSMLILLPKEDMADMEKLLTPENLNNWKNNFTEQEIDIYIPKFKFETKYSMAKTLKEMGMPTAFTWPGADFSGMDGEKDLFISAVIHQAFVEVNEEGTEAAAATAVTMVLGRIDMPKTIFRADHPFIFTIQERTTGSILFLGKVMDPTLS